MVKYLCDTSFWVPNGSDDSVASAITSEMVAKTRRNPSQAPIPAALRLYLDGYGKIVQQTADIPRAEEDVIRERPLDMKTRQTQTSMETIPRWDAQVYVFYTAAASVSAWIKSL